MKSLFAIAASALFAATALAQEGFVQFGSVAANDTGNNIIMDRGGRPLETGCHVELRQAFVKISGNRTNVTACTPLDIAPPDIVPPALTNAWQTQVAKVAQQNPTIFAFPIGAGDINHSPGIFSVHLSSTIYNVNSNTVVPGNYYFIVVCDPTTNYFKKSSTFRAVSQSTGINVYPKFPAKWAAFADQDLSDATAAVQYENVTDTDGDGLSDEFEASLGTDAGIADSDGDGFSDGFEYAHYMDPLSKYEPDFRLTTDYVQGEGTQSLSEGGTLYDLTWNSGVGLPYIVEHATVLPAGDQSGAWSNILSTNATANFTIFNINDFIEDPNGAPAGFFRLWYPGSDAEATSD